MIGWLLDTNVIAALINPNGAPSVKRWAAGQDEDRFFISILTLAEYDKGIENLPPDDENRYRYAAARDALENRFAGRTLSVSDAIVRRWGAISGRVKQATGHAPPVIDTLFAATGIEHNLYLATRNVKDIRPSGAAIFDPWQDDPERFPLSRR
ncbi:type II toxin-antitoxin system VapC family toxin [Neorhizobium galegae]|uniref:type II toxin-antitoxin system VapC family toxin n=1 Tax=Neorhizobium galegae TaxID=399 RepID=UPI00062218BE|nr:type II toxin-antitoxin system VapC family toxin [Neorhizobium galegae]CDZ28571.1 Putative plasmid stability protein [Neorhizobium galegae bv. officinalis]KAA9386066.1 type II toxin-antitoxin system VapC family toxin [Neorhizobium galegae]KAB1113492.1 type II toxin-antitoxin system VapC family toxin [Neorhizobium galegae]MCM2496453.1 type II toxin-antitoxin system VapC family toxin [Neorhizobium galegae]MCQ1770411.1 type II toxin-antitoxin system VapC family toxin [Neorhizobium galegae]